MNWGLNLRDLAIYRDTLYTVSGSGTDWSVNTLDIRPYRPIAKNTKTTIPVQFANAGDRINLKRFCPDAERIVFDVSSDKPPYLSINASNELVIASGQTDRTVLVKLKGINRIDATADGSFQFYLVILGTQGPVWRNVSELTMRAGSNYDLFQLVDAESIEFRSGRTRLAGSSLSNGVFTVGTAGGVAAFTARKGSRSSHIEMNIDVVQQIADISPSNPFRYRVEIEGHDVTGDLASLPSVSETLDPVLINEYRVNEASVNLRNSDKKYNNETAGNFWATHGLNPCGFQNAVKIYTEHFDDSNGNWVENLLFSGLILETFLPYKEKTFRLTCVDISSRLRNARVQDFGTLEKWDALRRQSDEENFEGVYVPDGSLLPLQPETVTAWADRAELTLSRLQLQSEGPVSRNSAYASRTDLRTGGGYLESAPIARFKTEHRSEDVRFLISQLALNKGVYNIELDIPGVSVADPFLLNRGSVALSVENTRTTRLPVDWVYDSSNSRILILLSNPEGHLSDLLVQYDLNSDSYRVLHAFDKDVVVHRIERRNSTNYYIQTAKPIAQDRSAQRLPRAIDSTGYAYDSAAVGSEIKIWHYSTSSGTLTEHVGEDDSRPPQLGIHYWVGFENSLYIDEFEGIVAGYRGAFKWHSNNLYYRYATASEFGVARVNTGGTTEEMIDQAVGGYQNHLNFAFDINSSGTIYFVYATGDAHFSTLIIKRRTSGGTESTILQETQGIGSGAFLGAHEALFHNNHLYILAPIQSVDFGEDATNSAADPDFIIEIEDTGMTGERYVTTSTNLNPSSTRLAPGEDIPIRIDFNSSVAGAVQSDLTARGGSITAFAISSDMIDITIRPDDPTRHKNIVIEIARNAVDQNNEATRIIVDFGTRRSQEKSAGAVLYRCNVTAATPTLEVLETYDFVQLGACNLVVHDGSVHFVEHPPAGAKFKPINPDLDGYYTDNEKTKTMGYNLLPESQGQLKRVNSSGAVEALGNLWYTDRPYNIAATRCLSIGDDLHLTMGYGNLDEVLRFNSLASAADNVAHIIYGRTLHYVLPAFSPNGSIYAALADIAKKINATLSFEKNIVMLMDRSPYRSEADGATGTGTGNLSFDNANKTFPNSGYLRIAKEILQYTGISGGAFTGIQRGVLGSPIANHADGTEIVYLDNIIRSPGIGEPYKEITLQSDTNRIYNVIRDSSSTAEVRDEDSIAKYGERPYTLDLGLTRHEKVWSEQILARYIEELKDLQQLVNIQTIPDFSLRLGQIVPFINKDVVAAMRIVGVRYEPRATHISGRTV